MKTFRPFRLGLVVTGLLTIGMMVWYFQSHRPSPPAVVIAPTPTHREVLPPSAPVAAVAEPKPTPAPVVEDKTEMAATARMYAAHASLRTPEVADPDSVSNRQILQTMVLKALAQSATPKVSKP